MAEHRPTVAYPVCRRFIHRELETRRLHAMNCYTIYRLGSQLRPTPGCSGKHVDVVTQSRESARLVIGLRSDASSRGFGRILLGDKTNVHVDFAFILRFGLN